MLRGIFAILLCGLFCPMILGQVVDRMPCRKLGAVRQLMEQDHFAEAKKLLQSMETGDEVCQAEHDFLNGTIIFYQGDDSVAQDYLMRALTKFRHLNHQGGIVRAAHQLALLHIDKGQLAKAATYLDEAIPMENALRSTDLFHEVLDVRAMLWSSQGDHEKAMSLLKLAASHTEVETDTSARILILNQIATNYQVLGEIDSAIFYYQQLIILKRNATDFSGLISDYCTLGGLHRELGNFKEAQGAFFEAIRYAERLEDTLSQVTIYIDVANVYLEEQLYDPAFENVEKAYQLASSTGMSLSVGQCLEMEGAILEQKNNEEGALKKYKEALRIYQQMGLNWQSAKLLVKMSAIDPDPEILVTAENALRPVVAQHITSGDKLGLLNARLLLCEVLLKQNKELDQVKEWLKDCEQWAVETQNNNDLKRVFLLKSEWSEKKGQYLDALLFYKKYRIIQDSLLALDNIREVRRLEKQFETVKKDKEIAEQQIVLEKQSANLSQRNTQVIILMISLFFTIALALLIGILYRRNRQYGIQKLNMMKKEREAEVLRAMIAGEEQERVRIARELHDNLGAMMATVKMRVGALINHFPKLKEVESYQKVEELLDDAYGVVREFSHNMIPGALRKYGLEQAIANICDAIESASDIQISFISYGLEELDNDMVETNVFQIVQELLQNVSKHAAAREVIVQLTHEDDGFQIVVEDDGKGFDIATIQEGAGMGIANIRTRVQVLKGTLDIDTSPGKGSTFWIHIPLTKK